MSTQGVSLATRHVVITGASRGLGVAIADTCWELGASLLLVARTAAGLEVIAQRLLLICNGQLNIFLFIHTSLFFD